MNNDTNKTATTPLKPTGVGREVVKTEIKRLSQQDDVSLSQFGRRRRPFAVDAAIGTGVSLVVVVIIIIIIVVVVQEWRQRGTAAVVVEEAMKWANAIAGYGNILGAGRWGKESFSVYG